MLLSLWLAASASAAPAALFSADYPATRCRALESLAFADEAAADWRAALRPSPADEEAVAAYRALRREHDSRRASALPETTSPAPARFAVRWRRLCSAGPAAARAHLSEDDARVFEAALAAVDRPLRPLWDREAPALAALARALERDWSKPLEAQSRRLRGAGLSPKASLPVALAWRPGAGPIRGSLESGAALLDVPAGADAGTLAEVAAHELVHAALAEAAPARAALERALMEDPRHGALACASLEEGLASALGNGLFRRRNRPAAEGPWDADPWTDLYARELLPLLERDLSRGLAAWAPALLEAARRHDSKALLRDRFRWAAVAGDGTLAPFAEALVRHLGCRGAWVFSLSGDGDALQLAAALTRSWATPLVLLASPERVEDAVKVVAGPEIPAEQLAWIVDRAKRGTAAALSWSPRGRPILVIAGRPEAVASALPAIPGMPAPSAPEPAAAPARAPASL